MIKILLTFLLVFMTFTASALSFKNVHDNEAIRANDGIIKVTVETETDFSFYVDDKLVTTIVDRPGLVHFTLQHIDRGTHTLRLVSRSEVIEITIHVLRHHL